MEQEASKNMALYYCVQRVKVLVLFSGIARIFMLFVGQMIELHSGGSALDQAADIEP